MKRGVRRYPLALLFSLLLSGFTIYAHEALKVTISKSANYLWQAIAQPVTPGGGHAAITQPTKQLNNRQINTEAVLETAQGNFAIPRFVLPGGGGRSTGGSSVLPGTIGQSVTGVSNGGSFSISGGFVSARSIQCETITITPSTLAAGQLGQPYSQQLAQSGGTGAIAWSISAGSLPNGVALNPTTGLLSGTPLTSGSFPFTAKVTDAKGCVQAQAYTLVIGCPVISISPTILPSAIRDQPYSQTLTATGGTPPYTFSFDGTPPTGFGLSTNGILTSSGALAPLTSSVSFAVKVTDAGGCISTQNYTVAIIASTYSVSGRVVDLTGNGVAGVTLAFSNTFASAGATQTDANGNWTQSGFVPGTTPSSCVANPYTLKASKAGYSFNPTSQTFCAASSSLNFTGAPIVTSVSAASFKGEELAQDSIIAAFGINLATKVEIGADTDPNTPGVQLPTSLAGTRVMVKDSVGTERLAPLFFVAPSQVNYLMPNGTAIGTATVTVTSGDNKTSLGTIQVAKVAPALFTANASGQGAPAANVLRFRNGVQTTEQAANPDFSPRQIDLGPEADLVYLVLYGGGIRNRTKPENISANLGRMVKTLNLSQFEDGVPSAEFVGLDQVNILLPRSLIGKGLIDVSLTVDGKVSNAVQINIK